MAKRKNVYEADDGTPHATLKDAVKHDREAAAAKYLKDYLQDKGVESDLAKNISQTVIQIHGTIGSYLKGKEIVTRGTS